MLLCKVVPYQPGGTVTKKSIMVWAVTALLWMLFWVGIAVLITQAGSSPPILFSSPGDILRSGFVLVFVSIMNYVVAASTVLMLFGWEQPFEKWVQVMKWAEKH